MTDLERKVEHLVIKVNLLEEYLKTVMNLPILGPVAGPSYESALAQALVKVGQK